MARSIPEASLTLSALFSGPLDPQSTASRGKEAIVPPSHSSLSPLHSMGESANSLYPAFPVWWPFLTSPRGREGGRDQPQTLCPSRTGKRVGPGSQVPSSQSCTHKHTPLHRAAAVHTVTHKHRSTYSNPQGQGGTGTTDCSGRGHTYT